MGRKRSGPGMSIGSPSGPAEGRREAVPLTSARRGVSRNRRRPHPLENMLKMPRNPDLNAYLARFAGQDDVLAQVARETGELPNAGMLSRPDAGGLLTLLGRMLEAREAIEVGTFTGYGAICLARGLTAGGRLTCYEVSPEYAEIARRNVDRAGLA